MAAEASRANQRYNLLYFSSKPGLKAAIEPRHWTVLRSSARDKDRKERSVLNEMPIRYNWGSLLKTIFESFCRSE